MKKLIVRDIFKGNQEIYRIPLEDDIVAYATFKLLITELVKMNIEHIDTFYQSRFQLYVVDES